MRRVASILAVLVAGILTGVPDEAVAGADLADAATLAGPDFTLSVSPASVSCFQGSSAAATVVTAVSGGFSSTISFSVTGLPAGATGTFVPSSIPLPAGSAGYELTITTSSSTPPVSSPLTVTGTGGGLSRTASLSLLVLPYNPDFSVNLSPASVSTGPGSTAATTVTATPSGGFTGIVTFSVAGLPVGATGTFGLSSIPPPPGGTNADLTIATSSSTPLGTFPLTVTGTGGGISRTAPLSLSVVRPDFGLSVTPTTVTVTPGASGKATIKETMVGGFSSALAFSIEGLPVGVSASFAPAPGPSPAGTSNFQLTLTTSSTTPPGAYPATVTGTGGGITRTVSLALIVTSPDFAISVFPASVAGLTGESIQVGVSTSASGGFNAPIALSLSGLPAGSNGSFAVTSIPAPIGTTIYSLTIVTSRATPAGTFPLEVMGTGGGLTRGARLTLTLTASVTPGTSDSRVVPIILDVSGVGSSRYVTELTLANRGVTDATLTMTYVAAAALGASGDGTVTESISSGRQLVLPDALAYLRGKGLGIPASGNQGGTLRVRFDGLSSADAAFAGARTTTASGAGRAGLSYAAIRPEEGYTDSATIYGLRENAVDRSNLALVNLSPTSSITLRLSLVDGSGVRTTVVPNRYVLGPGQWLQIPRVLNLAGFADGYARVDLESGDGPFYLYGVFNDNVTNDGSFVPPSPAEYRSAPTTLPVVVETPTFTSELVLANTTATDVTVSLWYAESLSTSTGSGGVVEESLGPYEQKILPDVIQRFREKGAAIGPRGAASYAGAVTATFRAGSSVVGGFIGARTGAPAEGGGRYGLFYTGSDPEAAAPSEAWIYGLQRTPAVRSNLAIVNLGTSGGASSYRYELYDGSTGQLAWTSDSFVLQPGGWTQVTQVLEAPGLANGYARVVKTGGADPFLAYGVVNDNATNDGSFVPGQNR